jgi:peptidoglycan/xylan/chitin deacetylase (PgdA/CDA1 family)
MHEFNLKMTKILIAATAFSLILLLVGGMSILRKSYYWHLSYFFMRFQHLQVEKKYFDYSYGGVLNWLWYRDSNQVKKTEGRVKKAESIPILLYHGVIDDTKGITDNVNIRLSDFQEQMFALKRAGYQTITLEDYFAFIKGKKDLPAKVFLLTFDDGRKDSFYPVDPILKTVGFSAVMNVITGRSLGRDNDTGTFHLSKLELQKMLETGRWEMASHGKDDHDYQIIDDKGTRGHFLSNKLWKEQELRVETDEEYKERVKEDLLQSKNDLENHLKEKIIAFAYPFGDYGQATLNYPEGKKVLAPLAESIYALTFIQSSNSDFPTNYVVGGDVSKARRINVGPDTNTKSLLFLMDAIQEKSLNFKDDFSYNKGWISGWGRLAIENKSLLLGSTPEEKGAMTFLGGSYLWRDYMLQAEASLFEGKAFIVAARYRDSNNYLACDYYDNRVVLSQKINGIEKDKSEIMWKTGLSGGNILNIGISVQKDKAACYLNGKPLVTGKVAGELLFGGVSFKIWDYGEKNAKLTVKNLKVTDLNVVK